MLPPRLDVLTRLLRRTMNFRFRVLDLQLPGEGVRTLPINCREVDRLCPASHFRRDLVERDIEDYRRRLSMDVATGSECLYKRSIS